MRSVHSIRAWMLAGATATLVSMPGSSALLAQAGPETSYTVLVGLVPVGNEQVTVERSAQGWTISSSGRLGAPFNIVLRTIRLRYTPEWTPVELFLDATIGDQSATLATTVNGTTAASALRPLNGALVESSDTIDARATMLPSPFVGPYAALAAQLKTTAPGSIVPAFRPRVGVLSIEVGESTAEQIKTVDRLIRARRTRTVFRTATAPPLDVEIWGDEEGRLLRVNIPAQSLDVVREDVGAVSARVITMSRPNDEDVRIPANGFSLAGTISRPASRSGLLPAVVLVGGSDSTGRDEIVAGVPIFGQIAHALADAGFLVLRYDTRGAGQSGGRPEAATLAEFADDARAAVKYVSDRKDIDRKRVAVVGRSEGGWLALMTAAKNGRVSAVGLISTAGVTGREVNLYEVTHGLERSGRPEAEQQATIALQKQIQQAVVSGGGWEAIAIEEPVRRQADTPYFQSFLKLDPERLMKDVQQPLLIVHGARDMQVPASNADRLEAFARARKKAPPVQVVKVPDINHLLVLATTGEMDEYGTLRDRRVSPAVLDALSSWLKKTLAVR